MGGTNWAIRMAEAGLESDARKLADLRGKSEVSHDGTTAVVPHFVPSGAIPEPSGRIDDSKKRDELLALARSLSGHDLDYLIAIAQKMRG